MVLIENPEETGLPNRPGDNAHLLTAVRDWLAAPVPEGASILPPTSAHPEAVAAELRRDGLISLVGAFLPGMAYANADASSLVFGFGFVVLYTPYFLFGLARFRRSLRGESLPNTF